MKPKNKILLKIFGLESIFIFAGYYIMFFVNLIVKAIVQGTRVNNLWILSLIFYCAYNYVIGNELKKLVNAYEKEIKRKSI